MTTLLGIDRKNATAEFCSLNQKFKYDYLQTDRSSQIAENQKLFWISDEPEDEALEDELEDVDYLLF